MTENFNNWIEKNKLIVSESTLGDSDIIVIEGLGKLLYLNPFEDKVIDSDFSFMLSDEEFDILDEKQVDYILFEFGTKFYYSGIKKDKNKYNEIIFKPEFLDLKNIGKVNEPFIMDFVHLGIHSEYEIMNGSGGCEAWTKRAKFLGHDALGICDKNTLAASLSFQTFCQKVGIKPILGETISVAVNYDVKNDFQETFDLKLYVTDEIGWKNLLMINKLINVDYSGFVPEERLKEYGEGLVCVIPKESELNYRKDNLKACMSMIKRYKQTFKEVFYQIDTLEYNSESLFRKHLENIDKYICLYKRFLKPILINDSYYIDEECSGLKEMLNKVNKIANPESSTQYFKSVGETIDAYSEWLEDTEPLFNTIIEAIGNTKELSDSINFKIDTSERKLPKFEVRDVEGKFFEELEKGVESRLSELSDDEMEIYLKRIETECNVIVPAGLCDYFMILWDVTRWCREKGIMVGSGRGSVCGSLVAYLLRITDVDPIKYNLLFERFLNATRVSGERAKSADSMPDIDSDFPTEYRSEVKKYIEDKYGKDFVCAIATYTRMKLKTCIKDFGKIKGISFDTMNRLTKDIDDWQQESFADLFEYASKSKALFKFVQEYPDIVHFTKYALLQCRAASVHPSAIVIVPKENSNGKPMDLYSWMPIKEIDGNLVSEWEGKYIDKSGFLKEDILGLTQLDKFMAIIKLIKKNKKITIDTNKIPFDDEKVFKYFKRGWCEDVFQFGTNGLMSYCKQVKPDSLAELIAMTALFRPGPMSSNAHQDFADIKNGKMKPHYDYGLKEITEYTYGLYVYQEQIMKAVHVLGGLSLVEADVLRTVMKKKDKKAMDAMSAKFIAGAIKNGCGEKEAKEIWEKLDKFSGYGFNESHSAAYSIMSYWSEWFKVNYPLEFWTTSFQNAKESDIPYRICELTKTNVGIELRPPDINFSEENFTCDDKENRIFFSLTKIKGAGEVAVKNIMETRNFGGKFFSFEEFLSRVPSKVNKGVIVKLIIAGAFDLIENLDQPYKRKDLLSSYLIRRNEPLPDEYKVPDSNTNAFWIFKQREATGFGEVDYETMVQDSIKNKRVASLYIRGEDFAKQKESDEVTVVGRVIGVFDRKIKNGTMLNLQIDSNNNMIGVTLWPDIWEPMDEDMMALKNRIVAINGRVKTFAGKKTLNSDKNTKLYIIS